jgi:uncharacterized protein YjbI with pentapeptide repeats
VEFEDVLRDRLHQHHLFVEGVSGNEVYTKRGYPLSLKGVNISDIDLRNSNLQFSDISNSKIGDLEGSDLYSVKYVGNTITNASMVDTIVRCSDMSNTEFKNVNLNGIVARNSIFDNCSFNNCDMTDAKFISCSFKNVTFNGTTKINKAVLSSSVFENCTVDGNKVKSTYFKV